MTVYERAISSVKSRGFYDHSFPITGHPLMLMQGLRLSEEFCEYTAARSADELADILIVLCQMAHISGMDVSEFSDADEDTRYITGLTLHVALGDLLRSLRKFTGEWKPVQYNVKRMAVLCHVIAVQTKIDLESAISEKLTADEKRGKLHGVEYDQG